MEDEMIQKIYRLTNELASQQQSNQELASSLTSQLSELKQKAANKYSENDQEVSIPSPLLPEQRDQVLGSLKLRLEQALQDKSVTDTKNKELEKECLDLKALIKEYEAGLETVASKLRSHSSAMTEGQVRLRREYEALLNAEKGTTAALFMENTILQTQLRQLSKTLRQLYKQHDNSQDTRVAQLEQENQDLRELLHVSKVSTVIVETSSPVLKVAKAKGVVEEFF